MWSCRLFVCLVVVLAVTAVAQPAPAPVAIVANPNLKPAGQLTNGVLHLQLDIENGIWHPEADDGPRLFVQAFAERGGAAQIPGPMVRVPQGTTIDVTVTNRLQTKATVYGLHTRAGKAPNADGLEVPPGESRSRRFLAGATGTYFYWARTTVPHPVGPLPAPPQPTDEDAQLNGAFIVDPPGAVPGDRVFVTNLMLVAPSVLHDNFEVVTINGKSYPFTEPLEYTAGDSIRWRVINPSFSEHPMHLHGAFFQVLSLGDGTSDTAFAAGERQSVVTQNVMPGGTMMLEWIPPNKGRWLFHCHFHFHMSADERVPLLARPMPAVYEPAEAAAHGTAHGGHAADGMEHMAGLVLVINIKPRPGAAMPPLPAAVKKLDLILEAKAQSAGGASGYTCSVRDGNRIVVSPDRAVGPPIVLTRGEPTAVTVINRLNAPTSIHWHGLELDSYYDGVVGAGAGDQVTPAVAPGGSFVARFTPTRAGTFIYHTHAGDPNQLSGGIYGGLVVLEPGQTFDPVRDRLMVIGTRDTFFNATRISLNGEERPAPMRLAPGVSYRLRIINIAPNLPANVRVSAGDQPATWRLLAKDGAPVPARLAHTSAAALHIASGETYDFEFRPDAAGELRLEVENAVTKAKLVRTIVVESTTAAAVP